MPGSGLFMSRIAEYNTQTGHFISDISPSEFFSSYSDQQNSGW